MFFVKTKTIVNLYKIEAKPYLDYANFVNSLHCLHLINTVESV